MNAELRPFRIAVPDQELTELQRRLAATRWPAEPADPGRYGTPTTTVRALVDHWRNGYDWRHWESVLNSYPQFTTSIDGATIHFLHIRSADPDAIPLILTHGWPGSVAEFLDVIGPLAGTGSPGPRFHLVIPSLPGFGWSGPTTDGGWGPRRIARAWALLMERLSYHRYGAAGNDWGSVISPELGRIAPDRVIGVHVTQFFSTPAGERPYAPPTAEPADLDQLSADDRQALEGLRWFQRNFGSYHHVHEQKPLTLGYALSDSPVGLLAWNHQVMGELDADAILTHVSIHWFTGTAGSAPMIYADAAAEERSTGPTTVPFGLANFADDTQGIRAYAEREHSSIVSWNRYQAGGHYAARQHPELLINDLREFFATVTAS